MAIRNVNSDIVDNTQQQQKKFMDSGGQRKIVQ